LLGIWEGFRDGTSLGNWEGFTEGFISVHQQNMFLVESKESQVAAGL